VDSEQDEDDLDDEDRDRLVDQYSGAQELDQFRLEIAALKELVEQARKVRESGNDSKLSALRECLSKAQFAELKDGRGKLLIFTEHRDTLNGIREHLKAWGYTTCQIHGGMGPRERKQAQEEFRTAVQVCVATEAAGEGINLQFCHLMINYDLPWVRDCPDPGRHCRSPARSNRTGNRFRTPSQEGEEGRGSDHRFTDRRRIPGPEHRANR